MTKLDKIVEDLLSEFPLPEHRVGVDFRKRLKEIIKQYALDVLHDSKVREELWYPIT